LELGEIVVLADESVLVEHVEFLAGRQLFAAEYTREALQMVDTQASSTYQLARSYLLLTATTPRPEPPTPHHTIESVNQSINQSY